MVVTADLTANLPLVSVDRVQMQQVLINLIVNACDAMESVEAQDRRLVVRTAIAEDEKVQFVICDTGCGIAPERLEVVFDPFVTTKTHGMGLGLAVCRTIVAAHWWPALGCQQCGSRCDVLSRAASHVCRSIAPNLLRASLRIWTKVQCSGLLAVATLFRVNAVRQNDSDC